MGRGRTFWLVALALAGCGGPSAPGGPAGTTMIPDAGPAGPFDITIASAPPIELPGTVLWLDANYGVARDGALVRAWTDRSGLGHVFEAAGDPGPTPDRLGGHGALRFGGQARMGLAQNVDERARTALTIGAQDLLVALVLRRDAGGAEPTPFALATPEADRPTAWVRLGPTLTFALGAATVDTGSSLPAATTTLVVATRQADQLTIRVNGQEVASGPAPALELPFLIPYAGGWKLDTPGFAGLIGDAVMVVGPTVEGATAVLETYLREKYGL